MLKTITSKEMSQIAMPNNTRCEASRHFRNKKKEYLKGKIN
jgi:hypothetical protein